MPIAKTARSSLFVLVGAGALLSLLNFYLPVRHDYSGYLDQLERVLDGDDP